MMFVRSCLVAGGDLRQYYLAKTLKERGYRVFTAFLEDAFYENGEEPDASDEPKEGYDAVILPLPSDEEKLFSPLSKNTVSLDEVVRRGKKGGLFLAGKVGETLRRACAAQGAVPVDYLEREELAVLNALPTAEGAVGILMQELPSTLFGSRCLVTGFGRVSRALVKTLVSLGASVTVAARKPSDLAWARIYGCRAVSFAALAEEVRNADAVINTVPSRIFDKGLLALFEKDTLLLDLASKPGGAECGDNFLLCRIGWSKGGDDVEKTNDQGRCGLPRRGSFPSSGGTRKTAEAVWKRGREG